jgi:microsomal dipeptidase-like Zn-dependent dipeptidase
MLELPAPDPFKSDSIGCSFPTLKEGNVKLQVMAIYTATAKGSTALALKQSEIFANFLEQYSNECKIVNNANTLSQISDTSQLGMIAAIENASGFCEEDEPLENGLKRLEQIISNTQGILYISFTHNDENRFGGGNFSKVGLKEDGKTLLQYLDGKKIAVDFSHTSDALAHGILEYISKHNLDVKILASHSNYRPIYNHVRNLPDDIANEIIKRGGIIGLNFLRAFMHPENPDVLYDHIKHGFELGAEKAISFGADFYATGSHPDRSRVPFYFKEQEDASCYSPILENIAEKVSPDVIADIAYKNAMNYLMRLWH